MSSQNFVACPQCGGNNVQRVGYTWWGGAIGPRLINHVKCGNCGKTFNGKTGNSNGMAIAMYLIAIIIIGFALGFAFTMM